jgi:prevent-host-death family protein
MYNSGMIEVSLTEARARLPELLTSAAAGEEIHILRHGRPVGVLLGHARWVKIQQHDVLIEARELRKRLEAGRGKPWPPPGFRPATNWDAEAHIAEIRRDRDGDAGDRLDA